MRKTLTALLAVYLVLLVWAILWKVHEPFIGRPDVRGIKLVPFFSGDGFGASDLVEVLANLALFVPFGIYLAALGVRWKLPIIIGASVALEVAQYVLATGSSDVTDVIMNTAGGALGLGLYALWRPRPRVLVWTLAAATVAALVVIGVTIASFPRMPGSGSLIV